MSESTRTETGRKAHGTKTRTAVIVAGTAVVLLVAGAAIQFHRSKESVAGDQRAASAGDPAGRPDAKNAQTRRSLGRVNGELISYDQVAAECMARYGEEVLDNFINRMVIHQACRKQNIEVTEAEVNEEIIKIAKKFDIDVENWMRIIQSERHLSPHQYRHDIIWPMLALKKLAGSEITISDADLQKAFVREFGEHVEARMIMCDNLNRAREAWNLVVKTPDDFSRVARERSTDPTSKSLGGKIPPIRRFAGNDNLEKEAFKLKKDEISGIIDVSTPEQKRYVILQCEGISPQKYKSIDAPNVREHLQRVVEEERTQQAVAKIFERLRKEATVDNYITNTSSHGIQQTSAASAPSADRGNVVPAAGVRVRSPQAPSGRRPSGQPTETR